MPMIMEVVVEVVDDQSHQLGTPWTVLKVVVVAVVVE